MTAESSYDESLAPPRDRTRGGKPPAKARARSTRARPRRRLSPLTLRILILNVLVLLIPVLGLLHLEDYRQSLIAAELDALKIQGRAFSLSLGSTAVMTSALGEERLLPEMSRHLMRVMLADLGVRARLFGRSGELVADSYVLVGPFGRVQVITLPPAAADSLSGRVDRLYKLLIDRLALSQELPLYSESPDQRAADYQEIEAALAGNSEGIARVDGAGHLVLSVGVPVQRYRQVLGALMLSKGGAEIETAVRERRGEILIVFGVALGVTILLSVYLAGTIARPVRRLAAAADRVRHGKGRTGEIPDFTRRHDEIGDLSGALRDMTAALWERMDAIEGFAADVAHEIKNPLTSLRSAVETVARVEDPEQQRKLMSIILDDVGRLDRLISDISDASRLDAELSRAQTVPVDMGRLVRTLVEVQRATVPEDRVRFRLEVAAHQNLTVQGIEGRLGQVLRNLLSNAITFSPEGGTIGITVRREGEMIEVVVSDEGPGIPEGKLEAIFDRFYSERPSGEKFGTHSGLGLSISKQIIEVHEGTIRAENRPGRDGSVAGARFIIRLPAD
jgi:two-component system sensor histidine kinase ChvG